jgi:WD40 repeat protein
MDTKGGLMVIATDDGNVAIFDLTNPTRPKRDIRPLDDKDDKPSVVRCLPGGDGFAVGSTKGKFGIEYMVQNNVCTRLSTIHSEMSDSYTINASYIKTGSPINTISFHPILKIVTTAGSSGIFRFWK